MYIIKKLKQLKYIIILLFFLLSVPLSYSQISYNISFDASKLASTTEAVDGTTYTRLQYPGVYSCVEPGSPELPVIYIQFSVPYNATDFSVNVTRQSSGSRILDNELYPVQYPIQGNKSIAEHIFVPIDSLIKNSSQSWPAVPAKVINDGFYDGDNHIVTVAVYPVSYKPMAKELQLYSNMTLILNYTSQTASTSGGIGVKPMAVSRPLPAQRQFGRNEVKQFVVNPGQVDGFSPNISRTNQRSTYSMDLPVYEYCVITNRELAPAFDRLIGWKQQKGYTAGVVCIEDILSSPDFQGGDGVSNINDDAGKLRAYLRYAYYNDGSAKYVLLGGKAPVVPFRYGRGYDYSPSSSVLPQDAIPTDLYFGDLNGNWNVDGDSHYGEKTHDAVDYYPELYVGRLLCTTKEEVNNYIEKLLRYELNPGIYGNRNYVKRAFYSQADGMQYNHEADSTSARMSSICPQYTIFSEAPSYNAYPATYPTGKQVVDEMNNGYGFFSWHSHGSPEGVSVKVNGDHRDTTYGVAALQGQIKYMVAEEGNGFNNLNNVDFPAIAYSTSCSTMPYDIYIEDGHTYDLKYNVGESFTIGGLYGGPAYLGNTRFGWYGGLNYSVALEFGFIKCLKDGNYNIGIAEANSKTPAVTPGLGNGHWIRLTHNLIGCPEFEMWTYNPGGYSPGIIIATRTDNSIAVSGRGVVSNKVAISPLNGSPEVKPATSISGVTFNNVSPNSTITIYRHNYIPYILPLYLQNEIQQYSRYVHAGKVFIGKNVDSSRTEGNYTVANGIKLTIEATEDVDINQGFVVQSEATVTLKSKGKVVVSGSQILDGGSLIVESGATDIKKNFTLGKGSVLSISKRK